MKKIIQIFLLAIAILGQNSLSAQEPTALNLEFVCELKVTTDKGMAVGTTAHGKRRIVPITGGTFEGPKIKGVVLNGGADYQFVNEENTRTEIEAIYNLKTDDGVLIHIRNVGVIHKTKEQAEAIKKASQLMPIKFISELSRLLMRL